MSNMSPSHDDLVARVCALVADTLELPPHARPIGPDTRLHGAGLGVDSIDALRLVAELEETFDVTIEDADLTPATFESVGSIVDLIRRLTDDRGVG